MARDDERSELYAYASSLQRGSGYLALIYAAIGLIFIVAWMGGDESGCYGGFDTERKLFNYHPVFMYTGMILLALTSLLSYRILPFAKVLTKSLHGLLHTVAISFVIIGLTCVLVGNNYRSKNEESVYYPNFFTLHSFIGLGAIAVYFQNYLLGAYHFLSSLQSVPVESRKEYMPVHIFLGTFAFILSIMAVLAGIMELFAENPAGCYYTTTEADTNPASHYHELPYGCKLANGAGVMVLLVAIFGLFALFNFRGETASKSETTFLLNH